LKSLTNSSLRDGQEKQKNKPNQIMKRIPNVLATFRPLAPEVRARVNCPDFIWKDEDILHVDLVSLCAGSGCTCVCAIAYTVEELESFARELNQVFSAKETVIHDRRRPIAQIGTIELAPGTTGSIGNLATGLKGDTMCGNHPNITGVVSWVNTNDTNEFIPCV
jgi:hypothetical protein